MVPVDRGDPAHQYTQDGDGEDAVSEYPSPPK